MVKFSYDLGKNDAGSTVNITLNINSTGAKNIRSGPLDNRNSYLNHGKSFTSSYQGMHAYKQPLLLYDGTAWMNFGDTFTFTYNDSTTD